MVNLNDLQERLSRYGNARDRETEIVPRDVTITDDEARVLARVLKRSQLVG